MYYGIIMAAVTMFAFQFLFNRQYEKQCGNTLRAAAVFSLGTSIVGFVILLALNRFRLEFTVFSFLVALAAAVNNLLYSYCSIKALGKINLSLYSVFAMLGGMTLPFIAGIAFFREAVTAGKLVCFALIAVSLFLTVERGEKSAGKRYYFGVFLMNGMSGVYAKLFKSAPYPVTGDRGYTMLITLCCMAICGVILITDRHDKIPLTKKAVGSMAAYGALCHIANYLLLIGLDKIPASAQYPMVTGGVMAVSTIICFFTDQKPTKKNVASVALSVLGILALVLLPE